MMDRRLVVKVMARVENHASAALGKWRICYGGCKNAMKSVYSKMTNGMASIVDLEHAYCC